MASVAVSYSEMSEVYEAQGKLAEVELFIRNLNINAGPDSAAKMAALHNELSGVYALQGKVEEDIELFKKCLEISVSVHGPNHPTVSAWYDNMAVKLKSHRKHEEALDLFEKSLAIETKLHGRHHLRVAASNNNMASVCGSLGKHETALELYEKSFDIWHTVHGPLHPSVAAAYNNIAGIYRTQGKYEEAVIQRLLQKKRDDLAAAGGRAPEDAGATGASEVHALLALGKFCLACSRNFRAHTFHESRLPDSLARATVAQLQGPSCERTVRQRGGSPSPWKWFISPFALPFHLRTVR